MKDYFINFDSAGISVKIAPRTMKFFYYLLTEDEWVDISNIKKIRSTLSSDITFTNNGCDKLTLILDPNSADRNVNPSGSFPDGFEVIVINNGPTGSYNLLNFDPDGLDQYVSPGDKQSFTYLLTEDKWI